MNKLFFIFDVRYSSLVSSSWPGRFYLSDYSKILSLWSSLRIFVQVVVQYYAQLHPTVQQHHSTLLHFYCLISLGLTHAHLSLTLWATWLFRVIFSTPDFVSQYTSVTVWSHFIGSSTVDIFSNVLEWLWRYYCKLGKFCVLLLWHQDVKHCLFVLFGKFWWWWGTTTVSFCIWTVNCAIEHMISSSTLCM